MEASFALSDGAAPAALETYQRATNTVRRLLESLGINRGRIARDVSVPNLRDYIAGRGGGRAIEHEDAD